jgi:hypothetical protein
MLIGAVLLLLTPINFAQTASIEGSIEGTVLDEQRQHVKAGITVTAEPIGVGWGGGCCPSALTDENGRFHFQQLLLISWALHGPYKEKERWGSSDIGFYGDTVEVKLSRDHPIANDVIVPIPPNPAVMEGNITDRVKGRPVSSAVFIFNRVGADGYMQATVKPPYHIMLPSRTTIRLKSATVEGYKPWSYNRTIMLKPGHHLKLDIRVQSAGSKEAER